MQETIKVARTKAEVLLTREQLSREKNATKAKFMPRNGALVRFPNGAVFRVVFSNVGQLRFTALFDRVVDMANPAGDGAPATETQAEGQEPNDQRSDNLDHGPDASGQDDPA